MVECELPKLKMRVRFPLLAPIKRGAHQGAFFYDKKKERESNLRGLAKHKNNQRCFYVCKSNVNAWRERMRQHLKQA